MAEDKNKEWRESVKKQKRVFCTILGVDVENYGKIQKEKA